MPVNEVFAAMARLSTSMDALAALGARLQTAGDPAVHPEIGAALDDVLAAAGIPDVSDLTPQQRASVAAGISSFFAQASDLLREPTRAPGWAYTDPLLLDGQGRASMSVLGLMVQCGELGEVTSFLDVGAGVGWLAIAAARQWPTCTVVGVELWEPSLELARRNVADAGLGDRIEIRRQDVTQLDDVDRFDAAWVPSFFLRTDQLAPAVTRVVAALRPGGCVLVGRYDPPADPLAAATSRLRIIRDGGALVDAATIAETLRAAGATDVHDVPRSSPAPLTFVAGRKA